MQKAVAGTTWGLDEGLLRVTHTAIVQGKMDHGLDVGYAFASNTSRKVLERVQLRGARTITGCTKDTPASTVLELAGLKSLEVRAMVQAGMSMARYASFPANFPIHELCAAETSPGLRWSRGPSLERPLDWTTTVLFQPERNVRS